MKIAFFGHDAGCAGTERRVLGYQRAGHHVHGFMMRRDEDRPRGWDNTDLGQTRDAAYLQRIRMIGKGVEAALKNEAFLREADIFHARNLDMLACAFQLRQRLGLSVPVIYESLDVHHLLTGNGPAAFFLRRIEHRLMQQTALLIYSSPGFEREYFAVHHKGAYTPFLIENRLVPCESLASRPTEKEISAGRLRLGWFGVLRCARTLRLLTSLAAQFPDELDITLRGRPAPTQVPDFHDEIARHPNIHFGGEYTAPDDLDAIYNSVDVVWAGDFYQAGYNSRWLLPCRLYEGGYFATPAIAPADSETGKWISTRNCGFTVPEDIGQSLPMLIGNLIRDRDPLRLRAENLIALPDEVFEEPVGDMNRVIDAAMRQVRQAA